MGKKEKKEKKELNKIYFDSFNIAGFTYYDGVLAFKELSIGDKVDLVIDDKNKHDQHALTIKYKKYKLGYVPKENNRILSKIIRSGHSIFEAYIQQKQPNVHPEEQIKVIVYLISNTGHEFSEEDEYSPLYRE